MAGVPPVFFKNTEDALTIYEVCKAAEETAGEGSIHGAQRIRGLWRVYPKTLAARVELLAKGARLKGKKVDLLSRNPFLLRDGEGKEIPVTKLFVAGVPISFSNEEIIKSLKGIGFVIRSKLDDERVRDPSGHLTSWVTGRRMCWVDIPKSEMPAKMDTGMFQASLFFKEMVKKIICNRCLEEGHKAVDCRGDEVCRKCKRTGHRAASCPNAWGVQRPVEESNERSKDVRRDEKMNEKRRDEDNEKCDDVQREGEISEQAEERVEERVEEELIEEETEEVEEKTTDEDTDESSDGEARENDGKSEREEVSLKGKEEEKEEEKKQTRGHKKKRRQSKKNEGKEVKKINNTGINEKKERGREILKEVREKKTHVTLDHFITHRSQSRKRTQSPEETSQPQRPKLVEAHADKKA